MSVSIRYLRRIAASLFAVALGAAADADAQVVVADQFEPNDTLATARTIANPGDFFESLSLLPGDLDFFKIDATAGGNIVLLAGGRNGFYSRIALLDASGNVLTGCDGDPQMACNDLFYLDYQVQQTGPLYVVFSDPDDAGLTGSTVSVNYEASIAYEAPTLPDQYEPNDSVATATPLSVPPDFNAVDLTLTPGDLDYFQLQGLTAGSTVVITGNGPSGPPRFALLDSDGNVVQEGSGLSVPITTAGDYTLVVTSLDDYSYAGSTQPLHYSVSAHVDLPVGLPTVEEPGHSFEFVAQGFIGAGITTDPETGGVYALERNSAWRLIKLSGTDPVDVAQGVNAPPVDTDGYYPYIGADLKLRRGFGGYDLFATNAFGNVVGFLDNGGVQPGSVFARPTDEAGALDAGLVFTLGSLLASAGPSSTSIYTVGSAGQSGPFMASPAISGGVSTLNVSPDRGTLYYGGFDPVSGQPRIVKVDQVNKSELGVISLPVDSFGLPPNFTVDRDTGDLYVIGSFNRGGDQLLRWNKAQGTLSVFAKDLPGANDVASGPCASPQDSDWCLYVTTEQGIMKIHGFGQDHVGPALATSATAGIAGYNFGSWTNQDVTFHIDTYDEDGVETVWYAVDDATCAPSSLGSCTVYSGNFVVSAPGVHNVTTFSKDKLGNFSPVTTSEIRIDKTPPTVAAAPTAPYAFGAWTNANSVEVSLSATDDGGSQLHSIFYAVDAASCQPSSHVGCSVYTAPFTITSEGDHVVTYFSTDEAGNASPVGSQQVRIDRTAPVVTATPDSPPEANGWYGTAPTVTFTGADPISGTPDATSGVASCEAPKLADHPGQSFLQGTCTDSAGNTGTVTFAYKYDPGNMPPQTTVVATAGSQPYTLGSWTNQTVQVSLEAFDTGGIAATYYAVDDPSCTPATRLTNCLVYSAPFAIAAEGQHIVTSFSQDVAGNIADASQAPVWIDKTPPVVAAVPSRPADDVGVYLSSFTVTWQLTDALSGLGDCDAPTTYSGPGTDTGLVSGTCRDKAGNQSGASYSFRYDIPLCSTNFAGLPTGKCTSTTKVKNLSDLNAWIAGPRTTNLKVERSNGSSFWSALFGKNVKDSYNFNNADLTISTNCSVELNPDARFDNVGNVTITASEITLRNDIYSNPSKSIVLRAGRSVEVKPASFVSNTAIRVESPTIEYRGDVTAQTASVALCGRDVEIEPSSALRTGEVYIRALNDLEIEGDILGAANVRMRAEDIELNPSSTIGSYTMPVGNVKIDAISELEDAGDIRATGNVTILSREYNLRSAHSFQVAGHCTISGTPECDGHHERDWCHGHHQCLPRPINGVCNP